jgi:stearoyl-CoA desaturase (delta-9 desaturase)
MERTSPAVASPAARWPAWLSGARLPFYLLHAGAVAALFVPVRAELVVWLVASYLVRVFGVTAGYHRYFSHRTFKLNRFWQLALAVLAQTSGQRGVLWWAAHHRHHHRYSDQAPDVHSPWWRTFWYAHVGWVLDQETEAYDARRVSDFGAYPELRWLTRHHWVPTAAYGAAVFLVGGWEVFLWGYVLSTVLVYHATFAINSLAHVWGTRPFDTPDESRNNFLLALVTLGEGWHNNHHWCRSSCRQGFRWWQIDPTFYGLALLARLGIVRDLRGVPAAMRAGAERAA